MRVSKTFEGYVYDETKAYEKSGKLYVEATCKCGRCCDGIYPSRIENNRPIPVSVDGGVCYSCHGTGFITKEIRLYTDKEFAKNERYAEARKEKAEMEKEKRMREEFAQKKVEWLEKNGFNEDGVTYVYAMPDSYDVKETLKELGFLFCKEALWHIAEVPEGYENKVHSFKLDELVEISAWGTGNWIATAAQYVKDKLEENFPSEHNSEWIGEEKERLRDISVVLKSVREIETKFGWTQLVTMMDGENIINWWTSVNVPFEPGDQIFMTATVKKHDEFRGDKITVVTRAKLTAAM